AHSRRAACGERHHRVECEAHARSSRSPNLSSEALDIVERCGKLRLLEPRLRAEVVHVTVRCEQILIDVVEITDSDNITLLIEAVQLRAEVVNRHAICDVDATRLTDEDDALRRSSYVLFRDTG